MKCCSESCKYFSKCSWSYVNSLTDVTENVEPFDRFGSGSYTYNAKTKQVEVHNHYMCENYSMYTGKEDEELLDTLITNLKTTEEKENKDMNDRLDVNVKIYNYVPDRGGRLTLETGKKVEVSSVSDYDTLVRIKYKDLDVVISASELEKAIKICSNNRW